HDRKVHGAVLRVLLHGRLVARGEGSGDELIHLLVAVRAEVRSSSRREELLARGVCGEVPRTRGAEVGQLPRALGRVGLARGDRAQHRVERADSMLTPTPASSKVDFISANMLSV